MSQAINQIKESYRRLVEEEHRLLDVGDKAPAGELHLVQAMRKRQYQFLVQSGVSKRELCEIVNSIAAKGVQS